MGLIKGILGIWTVVATAAPQFSRFRVLRVMQVSCKILGIHCSRYARGET